MARNAKFERAVHNVRNAFAAAHKFRNVFAIAVRSALSKMCEGVLLLISQGVIAISLLME